MRLKTFNFRKHDTNFRFISSGKEGNYPVEVHTTSNVMNYIEETLLKEMAFLKGSSALNYSLETALILATLLKTH
jgi:hypothetical protein